MKRRMNLVIAGSMLAITGLASGLFQQLRSAKETYSRNAAQGTAAIYDVLDAAVDAGNNSIADSARNFIRQRGLVRPTKHDVPPGGHGPLPPVYDETEEKGAEEAVKAAEEAAIEAKNAAAKAEAEAKATKEAKTTKVARPASLAAVKAAKEAETAAAKAEAAAKEAKIKRAKREKDAADAATAAKDAAKAAERDKKAAEEALIELKKAAAIKSKVKPGSKTGSTAATIKGKVTATAVSAFTAKVAIALSKDSKNSGTRSQKQARSGIAEQVARMWLTAGKAGDDAAVKAIVAAVVAVPVTKLPAPSAKDAKSGIAQSIYASLTGGGASTGDVPAGDADFTAYMTGLDLSNTAAIDKAVASGGGLQKGYLRLFKLKNDAAANKPLAIYWLAKADQAFKDAGYSNASGNGKVLDNYMTKIEGFYNVKR